MTLVKARRVRLDNLKARKEAGGVTSQPQGKRKMESHAPAGTKKRKTVANTSKNEGEETSSGSESKWLNLARVNGKTSVKWCGVDWTG